MWNIFSFQLLRISFVVVIACVWCVIGETMTIPKVISNHFNKNETKTSSKLDVNVDDKARTAAAATARTPRQLDPNIWQPIPAAWSPRPRSPLNTWWGLSFPFDGNSALIRVRPPGAYLPPHELGHEHHHHDPYHHDHHHHDHHHKHEHHGWFKFSDI